MKKLKIGFTYDARSDYKLLPGEAHDRYTELDTDQTISEIENALKSGGHDVVRIGNARALINKVTAGGQWDLVFNIAEGLSGRNRESQVPALLEMFGIPYSGSDALTMGLTLDKAAAKKIVTYHGVVTPGFIKVSSEAELKGMKLNFPVIIKPAEDGSSKGIFKDSTAECVPEAAAKVRRILSMYHQPALVEEFISGLEFTVAVIGNEDPEALPPVQIAIKGKTDLGSEYYIDEMADLDNKDLDYICPSKEAAEMLEKMKSMSVEAYKALGCRDFSRMDFRVDKKGQPYFLECNPLPHLGSIDVFPLVAKAVGLTHEEIIVKILDFALKRYNLI